LVMGLGLHGGGLESARFLLKRGAEVSVTDLRDEKTLSPSIERLDTACGELGGKPVRYILGRHEIEDFKNADIVIKNPGVRPDSPFLQAAKQIETDISLFLSESKARLFAVTGSKGKSFTSSALNFILNSCGKSFLGGNITVSPLNFPQEPGENDNVVLELSSFQLGDLKGRKAEDGSALLKPAASILTSIMPDHLDRYASMEDYIDDKKNIYRGQDSNCVTVAGDDDWGKSFLSETKARKLIRSHKQEISSALSDEQSGGCIDSSGRGIARLLNFRGVPDEITELVPQKILTPGSHQKINMLSAALAVFALGGKAQTIRAALSTFPGIEHRLEFFHESNGIRYYNDSAATIPEAAAACIEALTEPSMQGGLILVTGGTDKNLDFTPLARAAKKAKSIILLEGTGSEKLIPLLRENGVSYSGPFNDLDKAVHCAREKASGADIVALSPGCASFGMFLNEFDRGMKWKEAVARMAK